MVRPGATAAALATRNQKVGVIATQATVRSRAYFQAIKEEDPFVEVHEHATPRLVPLVEAGQLDGGLVEEVVSEQLGPLLGSQLGIDTLLLGCTHYPLLAPVIRRVVGPDVAVIDSASATASALAALLEMHALNAPRRCCAHSRPAHDGRSGSVPGGGKSPFRRNCVERGKNCRCRSGVSGHTQAPPRRRNEKAIGVGLAVGAAGLAIASRYLAKRAHDAAADGLVDWPRAEQLAVARLSRVPGALSRAELRAAEPAYERAMAQVVPLLERQLGMPLPGVVERHAVVDRAGWARANIATFAQLIGHLEPHVRAATGDRGFASGVTRLANRFLTTQQVGFLLGYLGGRVLGQYDIALLSAEANPGKLLFVEENIRGTAATLNVPIDDFRTWIVLHEATHAFEFEANSWLRPYIRDRLERQLAGVLDQAKSLQSEGVATLIRRVRESSNNPLAAFLSPSRNSSSTRRSA